MATNIENAPPAGVRAHSPAAIATRSVARYARPIPSLVGRAIIWSRDAVLQIGGLGCIGWAAWLAHPIAGYVAAGISLLIIQALWRPMGRTITDEDLKLLLQMARSTTIPIEEIIDPKDEDGSS